ncbi:MAG: TetR/AcrR family transcriptional regulator [Victivallaceae bacterium]|nr:TetR/AcrR family transcriptional regulator [Victivallaceae bacterium]
MPKRKDGLNTKEKILRTAAGLFATRGYRRTTNLAITQACGVNAALICYYFGDKAALYAAAWDYAQNEAVQKYPFHSPGDEFQPAVKRLHSVIAAEINRRSDPELFALDFMLNELTSPTGLLPDVYEKALSCLRAELRLIVGEILGPSFTPAEQRLAVLSIFALCIVPVKQIQQMEGNPEYQFAPAERIEYVYNFSMAGLLGMLNRKK